MAAAELDRSVVALEHRAVALEDQVVEREALVVAWELPVVALVPRAEEGSLAGLVAGDAVVVDSLVLRHSEAVAFQGGAASAVELADEVAPLPFPSALALDSPAAVAAEAAAAGTVVADAEPLEGPSVKGPVADGSSETAAVAGPLETEPVRAAGRSSLEGL